MICLLNLTPRLFFPTWLMVIFLAIFANICRANNQVLPENPSSQNLGNFENEHGRVLDFEAMHKRSNQRNEIVTVGDNTAYVLFRSIYIF